jgi:hypothetical protein
MILRLVADREAQPTAVVLDGRTPQSTPESGGRAGYDGAKRKNGSKFHAAVDTLGHLLALEVAAAREQEWAQVAELTARIQEVTGRTVEFVDHGYTGDAAAGAAEASGLRLEVVKHTEARKGFVLLPRRWGGRADVRVAGPVPPLGAGLRAADGDADGLAVARPPRAAVAQARTQECMAGSSDEGGHAGPGGRRRRTVAAR